MYKQTHEWSKIHFWVDKIDSATPKWSYFYKIVLIIYSENIKLKTSYLI